MSRTMPTECEHGEIVDWGDFGPCQDCDEHPDDDCPNFRDCRQCKPLLGNLGRVEPGSVLHIADANLDRESADRLRLLIAQACGHQDFVIIVTNGWVDIALLNEEKMVEHGWVRENGRTEMPPKSDEKGSTPADGAA